MKGGGWGSGETLHGSAHSPEEEVDHRAAATDQWPPRPEPFRAITCLEITYWFHNSEPVSHKAQFPIYKGVLKSALAHVYSHTRALCIQMAACLILKPPESKTARSPSTKSNSSGSDGVRHRTTATAPDVQNTPPQRFFCPAARRKSPSPAQWSIFRLFHKLLLFCHGWISEVTHLLACLVGCRKNYLKYTIMNKSRNK